MPSTRRWRTDAASLRLMFASTDGLRAVENPQPDLAQARTFFVEVAVRTTARQEERQRLREQLAALMDEDGEAV